MKRTGVICLRKLRNSPSSSEVRSERCAVKLRVPLAVVAVSAAIVLSMSIANVRAQEDNSRDQVFPKSARTLVLDAETQMAIEADGSFRIGKRGDDLYQTGAITWDYQNDVGHLTALFELYQGDQYLAIELRSDSMHLDDPIVVARIELNDVRQLEVESTFAGLRKSLLEARSRYRFPDSIDLSHFLRAGEKGEVIVLPSVSSDVHSGGHKGIDISPGRIAGNVSDCADYIGGADVEGSPCLEAAVRIAVLVIVIFVIFG